MSAAQQAVEATEREKFEAWRKTAPWYVTSKDFAEDNDEGASVHRMMNMSASQAWAEGRAALRAELATLPVTTYHPARPLEVAAPVGDAQFDVDAAVQRLRHLFSCRLVMHEWEAIRSELTAAASRVPVAAEDHDEKGRWERHAEGYWNHYDAQGKLDMQSVPVASAPAHQPGPALRTTPLYDLALVEFQKQRFPLLLWRGLVKQLEEENHKLQLAALSPQPVQPVGPQDATPVVDVEAMKDGEIAKVVNELRERIAHIVVPLLRAPGAGGSVVGTVPRHSQSEIATLAREFSGQRYYPDNSGKISFSHTQLQAFASALVVQPVQPADRAPPDVVDKAYRLVWSTVTHADRLAVFADKIWQAALSTQPVQPAESAALTDAQIDDLWIRRDCMKAIQAGDICAQVRCVVRAAILDSARCSMTAAADALEISELDIEHQVGAELTHPQDAAPDQYDLQVLRELSATLVNRSPERHLALERLLAPASRSPAAGVNHSGDNDVDTATLLDESADMLEEFAVHKKNLGYDSAAAGADAHAYRLRHLAVIKPAGVPAGVTSSVDVVPFTSFIARQAGQINCRKCGAPPELSCNRTDCAAGEATVTEKQIDDHIRQHNLLRTDENRRVVRASLEKSLQQIEAEKALRESPAIIWPKEKRVGRREDMSPDGTLIVGLDSDNDVYVEVSGDRHGEWKSAAVEFCNGGGGGGQSSHTRAALINLMTAIEADNAKLPHKAHPPPRASDKATTGASS